MQKVINVLAVLSFAGTAGIVGSGAYVYLNKDALIEKAKENATEAIMAAVTDALPGMVSGAMPELPGATGGAIPGGDGSVGIPGGGAALPF